MSPKIDASQDYRLLSAFENDTHTVVRFSRRWSTCDGDHDWDLGSGDTVRLIWAVSPEDPDSPGGELPYHESRRGAKSVYLKEPPLREMPESREEGAVKAWDLKADNLILPDDDHTHYWCSIFESPELDRKHHMIGFEPIIQKENEAFVHHMVLYECHFPRDSAQFRRFRERAESGRGERCYSPNMPPEWTYCLATNTWAWAVGSDGESLPGHVGVPLGGISGGADFFMLETHYDNPEMVSGIRDSSGLRIFYTDRLRRFDGSMLLLGSEVNFLQMIPPLQESFASNGRCSAECTRNGIPPSGIRILNGVLHSHLAGRKLKLRHIRGAQELPPILRDDHYDFNFQASRAPNPGETLVLPGDELILECEYDTSDRNQPTFGGLSTREEMCLAFILYYPRAPLADCRSLPSLRTVKDALGIDQVYGEAFEKLEQFMQDIGGSESKLQYLSFHSLNLECGLVEFITCSANRAQQVTTMVAFVINTV